MTTITIDPELQKQSGQVIWLQLRMYTSAKDPPSPSAQSYAFQGPLPNLPLRTYKMDDPQLLAV